MYSYSRGSSNGRTLDFGSGYAGSSPAPRIIPPPRMHRALASLYDEYSRGAYHDSWLGVFREGPLEEIRRLEADLDTILGNPDDGNDHPPEEGLDNDDDDLIVMVDGNGNHLYRAHGRSIYEVEDALVASLGRSNVGRLRWATPTDITTLRGGDHDYSHLGPSYENEEE